MSEEDISKWFPVLIFKSVDLHKKRSLIITLLKVISLSIIISLATAFPLYLIFGTGEEAAIFKESTLGEEAALLNLAFYISLVVLFSAILYLLIKSRKIKLIGLLQVLFLSYIAASMASIIVPIWLIILVASLSMAFGFFNLLLNIFIKWFGLISYVLFIVFGVLQAIALLKEGLTRLRNYTLLLSVTWAGSLVGLFMGFYTPLILMVGFAIYDVFAVFKGPIKKISEELSKVFQNREERALMLGLGDIFFYSMAVSYALAYIDEITSLIVGIAIACGVVLTGVLLARIVEENQNVSLPALPIPLTLALLVIFIKLCMIRV
ncbi:MAG: hypothetical protein ACTSVA_04490 [Candidatus Njordarchaeales archaeon]